MKYNAIIFDLDGTLWDSTASVADGWNFSLSRMAVAHRFTAEDIAGIMGCTDREIEEKLFSGFGADAHRLCRRCIEEESPYIAEHGGKIYTGVEAMLEKLSAKYPLFIVSNCQSGYVEAFLTYSGFGRFFRDFEYLGRQGLSKRENILLIMERHGLEKAVYVGDTAHDEISAKSAGCDFIFAGYGFGKCTEPMAVIHSPMELIDLPELTGEEHE